MNFRGLLTHFCGILHVSNVIQPSRQMFIQQIDKYRLPSDWIKRDLSWLFKMLCFLNHIILALFKWKFHSCLIRFLVIRSRVYTYLSTKCFKGKLLPFLLSDGLGVTRVRSDSWGSKTRCVGGWLLFLDAAQGFDPCLLGVTDECRELSGFWRPWRKYFVSCLSHSLQVRSCPVQPLCVLGVCGVCVSQDQN